jgi:Putative bacterial sensory transduction regulator
MKHFVLLLACFALTADVVAQTKVYRAVSNETIEKTLQSLDIKYQKSTPKEKDGASMYFDFTRGSNNYRLKNYSTDLWIEQTIDKKMPLEDVNRWNAEAKFSRLVLIDLKDKTTLSLEFQLDCVGGVTDAMVKQYINRFDEEAKRFAKFK